MTSQATATHPRVIVVDYDLPYPPEKVWRVLTESALISRWLMKNDFVAEVGHHFTFHTEPMPQHNFDGIVHCEVLAVDRLKRLRYSWRGGNLDTTVTWTLTATPGGTLVRLEQAGFGVESAAAFEALNRGWRSMKTGRLGEVLATLA
jgi:uncharacterized protein YndB with AHSA1/START domain